MKDSRHDDERLAALLGGRLEGPEREEVLAHLLADDEDYQVFADTAAILQEAEDEEAAQAQKAGEQADHPPVRRTLQPSARPGWRRWKAPRVIVPAVLAGLVVLGIFQTRGGGTSVGDPVQLASNMEQPLPENWEASAPGATWRGGASSAKTSRSVRAGALLVDLTLAVKAQDTVETRRLAKSVRERFDDRAVPSSAIRQLEERAGEDSEALLPLVEQAKERLADGLEREYMELGAWGEAALLAAYYGNMGFFRSETTRTMLDDAEDLTRENQRARDALVRIRATVAGEGTLDGPTLTALVNNLMDAVVS